MSFLLAPPCLVKYLAVIYLRVFIKKNVFFVNIAITLLILSGDVALNPGPGYSCGVCSVNVEDCDRAILCDMCETWYHVSCDPLISDSQYDAFVQSPNDVPWFCSRCVQIGDTPASFKFPLTNEALTCLYLNARSNFSKWLDLAAYLASLQYDIVAITESFLDNTIVNSLIVPQSYIGHRLDRNRHGGGILVLVRDNLTVVRHSDLESDYELLWLELFSGIGPVLFGTFYRSPGSDVSALNSLTLSLLSTQSKYPIVLCGDFNLPSINWSTISLTVSSPNVDNLRTWN